MPNQSSPHARQQHRADNQVPQSKADRLQEIEETVGPLLEEALRLSEEIDAEQAADAQAAEGSQAGEQAEPGETEPGGLEPQPEATTEPDSGGSEPSESNDQTAPVSTNAD